MTIAINRALVTGVLATAAAAAAAAVLTTPPAAHAAATKKVTFRGMTLAIPSTWVVEKDHTGDWVSLSTRKCRDADTACPALQLVGPKVLKGGDYLESYKPGSPFAPSTGVAACRLNPTTKYGERFVGTKPLTSGYRPVGAGHKAEYRVWAGECYSFKTDKRTATFKQREWYLPKSKILIVDGYGIAATDAIIKTATWN